MNEYETNASGYIPEGRSRVMHILGLTLDWLRLKEMQPREWLMLNKTNNQGAVIGQYNLEEQLSDWLIKLRGRKSYLNGSDVKKCIRKPKLGFPAPTHK